MPTSYCPPSNITSKAACFFLGAAVMFAYGISLRNGFVWDDTQIIVNNLINREWANLPKILLGPDVVYADDPGSYYRPLNRLMYAIEYHLYGLQPFGYHLLNLLLHLGNVILLFTYGKKIFASSNSAFIAALFFAVHPINSEAINFISGRNNLFTTFFVLASLLFFHFARERHSIMYTLLSTLSFLGGLFCKEIALMLLPILFFYPIQIESSGKLDIKGKVVFFLPFILATLIYFYLRFTALSQLVLQPGMNTAIWDRLIMNLYIIPAYASLLVVPFGYKVYYPLTVDIWQNLKWLLPVWGVFGCICYLLIRSGSKIVYFALLWLLCNYVPISNIIEIPSGLMAERFTYLPFIGIWLLIGAITDFLIKRGVSINRIFSVAAVIAIVLAFSSSIRSMDWENDLTLFSSLVAVDPQSVNGHYNLGGWYREHNDLINAQIQWEQTVRLQPRHTKALSQLGSVAFVENRLNDAERLYRLALSARNDNAEAQYNLALILEMTGRNAEALDHYKLFLNRVPPEYTNLIPDVNSRIMRLQGRNSLP